MTGQLETKSEGCLALEACKAFEIKCNGQNYKNCKIWESYTKQETTNITKERSYFPINK